MTDVHPLLAEALERFETAEQPDVLVRNVVWPEFNAFNRCFRDLVKQRTQFAYAPSVESDIARFGQARRVLRSSFCMPSDPDVGLTQPEPDAEAVTGELGVLQNALREAAAALAESQHPGLEVLQIMLNGDVARWPREGVTRVVVPGSAVAGTRRALGALTTPEGVQWDVCTLTEAKRRTMCAVTLLAGSPELHVDWRTPPEWRHRLIAWLFNAPMSPHVVAMLWSGSQPFEAARYEVSRTSSILDPRVFGTREHVEDTDPVEQSTSIAPPSRATPTDVRLPAIDFELPGRSWISFGLDHGPRPVRIDDDSEFDIDVEDSVPVRKLGAGDVLVIVEGARNFELRRSLCADWVDRQKNGFTAAQAQTMVDEYKKAVRARSGDREFVVRLRQKGLDDGYIQQQLARAVDRRTIAPQHKSTFEVIAAAAGFEPPAEAWAQIRALRGGYSHAGRAINDRLKEAVTKDLSWFDTIGRREMARIDVAELGTVTLAPILAVSSTLVDRAESELGELIRP